MVCTLAPSITSQTLCDGTKKQHILNAADAKKPGNRHGLIDTVANNLCEVWWPSTR